VPPEIRTILSGASSIVVRGARYRRHRLAQQCGDADAHHVDDACQPGQINEVSGRHGSKYPDLRRIKSPQLCRLTRGRCAIPVLASRPCHSGELREVRLCLARGEMDFRCRERPQPTQFAAEAISASPKARSTVRAAGPRRSRRSTPRSKACVSCQRRPRRAPAKLAGVMYTSRR
jgi:hypothetical protein